MQRLRLYSPVFKIVYLKCYNNMFISANLKITICSLSVNKICLKCIIIIVSSGVTSTIVSSGLGEQGGAVVRVLASHQCVLGSIPRPGVICGLSLLLVLFSARRGFSPGTPVFPSPQKPTFPNSNLIWNCQALYHDPLAQVIAQALSVFDKVCSLSWFL